MNQQPAPTPEIQMPSEPSEHAFALKVRNQVQEINDVLSNVQPLYDQQLNYIPIWKVAKRWLKKILRNDAKLSPSQILGFAMPLLLIMAECLTQRSAFLCLHEERDIEDGPRARIPKSIALEYLDGNLQSSVGRHLGPETDVSRITRLLVLTKDQIVNEWNGLRTRQDDADWFLQRLRTHSTRLTNWMKHSNCDSHTLEGRCHWVEANMARASIYVGRPRQRLITEYFRLIHDDPLLHDTSVALYSVPSDGEGT